MTEPAARPKVRVCTKEQRVALAIAVRAEPPGPFTAVDVLDLLDTCDHLENIQEIVSMTRESALFVSDAYLKEVNKLRKALSDIITTLGRDRTNIPKVLAIINDAYDNQPKPKPAAS